MHVEHFMTKEVVSVGMDASCQEAASLMKERNVGCVVVLDNAERVVGIATDRDLAIKVCAQGTPASDVPITDVMTQGPATVTLDDNIFSVVDTMRSAHMARRIPVVDNEKHLLGIVSISDVAVIVNRLLTEVMREETHHALEEAHQLTGAKRMAKQMRSPQEHVPRDMQTRQQHPTTPGTQGTTPATGGGRGASPQAKGQQPTQSGGGAGTERRGSQSGSRGNRST